MSTQEPGRAPAAPALTALPRLEDIPRVGEGYEPDKVREAFESFRRHAAQQQAQLRVLQAAGRGPQTVEAMGHAVRMDALHLIRAAAEFADTVERDAQTASAAQIARTEEEVSGRQHELQAREAESERLRAETLNAAKNEARELLASANRDATQEVREAEASAARLLEQARHQATELTNATRAEVEQTLEWARAQASAVLARAQHGTEQLLAAAGLGEAAISEVAEAIVRSATAVSDTARGPAEPPPAGALAGVATPISADEPVGPPVSPVAEEPAEEASPPITPPVPETLPPPPPVSGPPPPVSPPLSPPNDETREDATAPDVDEPTP